MTRAIRALAVVLGAAYVATGGWALLGPSSWARSYPGLGRHWVRAGEGASAHLAGDAGAGFLAVGVVLLVAAVAGRRALLQLAGVALVAHALPHFLFHLAHPDEDLPALDLVVGVWGLALQALLGLGVIVGMRTPRAT